MSLFGTRVLICGGSNGIGRGIAKQISQQGGSCVILSRNERDVLDQLSSTPKYPHEFHQVDATLIKDIDRVCHILKLSTLPIHSMILTQGKTSLRREETIEGIDQKMAVHYYGRIAFIENLLPKLRHSISLTNSPNLGGGKILSVLSAGVHSTYDNFNDLDLKHSYSIKNAADSCGYYNDLVLDYISQQEENNKLTFYHAAPGFVNSNWGSELPSYLVPAIRFMQKNFGKSPEKCGQIMINNTLLYGGIVSGDKDGNRSGSVDRDKGFHCIGENGQTVKTTKKHNKDCMKIVYDHTQDILRRARRD